MSDPNIDTQPYTSIELSQPIDRITLSAPDVKSRITNTDGTHTAISDITDDTGKPYIIKMRTTVREALHDASNRAYFDLSLDDSMQEVFNAIDKQLYQYVLNYHANDDWFGKQLPCDIIRQYCNPLVATRPSKPHPYVRIKTSYSKKKPNVLLTTSSVEKPEDGTCETIHSFSELTNKEVVYEVQLKRIRFCPTTFNPELKLVKVHQYVQPEQFDPMTLLLNNANHADRRDDILAKQKEMEAQKLELLRLKELKEEVEREVAEAIAKRDDIDEKFKHASETIEAMRRAADTDGYSDATEAPIMGDVEEILDEMNAKETTTTDEPPPTTQTCEPATNDETTCEPPCTQANAPDDTCEKADSPDATPELADGVDLSTITETAPATDAAVQEVVAEEVDAVAKEVTFAAGEAADGVDVADGAAVDSVAVDSVAVVTTDEALMAA